MTSSESLHAVVITGKNRYAWNKVLDEVVAQLRCLSTADGETSNQEKLEDDEETWCYGFPIYSLYSANEPRLPSFCQLPLEIRKSILALDGGSDNIHHRDRARQ